MNPDRVIRVTMDRYITPYYQQSLESYTSVQSTPYNAAHHRFAVFTAVCVFLLIMAGALVTSNDAGLSVPDWPTSFGSFYRVPPMVGGVLFEHGHRMIAQFIGLLTIALAVWTQRVDRRPWMRTLGWVALGTVIAQGILGGLTVLFYLPPAISTAHATLAQTFFCIIVCMALFTGRNWVEAAKEPVPDASKPRITTLTTATVACVWLQLILGAAFRHSGLRIIPHIIGAIVVTGMIHWAALRTIKLHRDNPQLRKPAIALLSLLGVQLVLGIAAYFTRLVWTQGAIEPMAPLVISTVAHVSVGALVLATSVVLVVQARRLLTVEAPITAESKTPRTVTA